MSQYDEMIKFLSNLYRTQRFQKTSTPKPLSANLVDDVEPSKFVSQAEPTPSNKATGEGEMYAVQDWAIFLNSDEGRHFISEGNQLPSEAREALYSLMKGKEESDKGKGKGKGYGGYGKGYGWNPDKGKGKGKGWESDKGKGKGKGFSPKGGYKGPCHKCNEWGHYARECPQNEVQLVDDGDWGQWYSGPNHQVTLMLTDQPFIGYGNKFGKGVVSNPATQINPANSTIWQTVGGKKSQLGPNETIHAEPKIENPKYFMPDTQSDVSVNCATPIESQLQFPSLDPQSKSKRKKNKQHMPKFIQPKKKVK